MCGLAGIVSLGLSGGDLAGRVEAMRTRLLYRGPDDQGTFIDHRFGVGLAHQRLSVIDLSNDGHQPMSAPDGRYTIVFMERSTTINR